jgi:hypothetical protein
MSPAIESGAANAPYKVSGIKSETADPELPEFTTFDRAPIVAPMGLLQIMNFLALVNKDLISEINK